MVRTVTVFKVFAYGSNMSTARLRARTPSARPLGVGRLDGHVLRWHKRSHDGSGKCDAVETGEPSDTVWGVLFEIDRAEKQRLDAAEGLHRGYEEKHVEVVTDAGAVRALLYYATDLDASRRPYEWYKAFVVAGAREHGLPGAYVRGLERMESIPDPDLERAARNAFILSGP